MGRNVTASSRRDAPAVVLVADRTLSGDYRVLFEGIFATMQTTKAPAVLMRCLLSPPAATDETGRARVAPLALRRIEASLIADAGLDPRDVAVTTPERVRDVIGPGTRIVAVSSSDPLGGGMSNTTTSSFWGGQLYTRLWTDRMMAGLREAKQRHGFRVLAGGAGAWQWASRPEEARRQGIDCVFEGSFESQGPALVASVLDGGDPPAHVVADGCAVERVRPIRGASTMGVVELSRGCGNGCRYCTMARRPMAHLPAGTILADLEANLAGGVRSVVSSSEDFFRYCASGSRVNYAALAELLRRMRTLADRPDGLSFMQIDHANVSSVVQMGDGELGEIRRLLQWKRPSEYLWVNLGVESANGRLVAANGRGKLGGFDPDDWEAMVRDAVDRLRRTGFFPVLSLVLGLPGETPADVARTDALVRRLARGGPLVVFPVFYEPVRPGERGFGVDAMRLDHLDLYTRCYDLNFRYVPRLYADNQRAGGVPHAKRMLLQLLGRGEVAAWRRNFARIRRMLRKARHRKRTA